MKYGTYTTIDCPVQHVGEAFEFLKEEFEKIGGTVKKVTNTHDLGEYYSFEIYLPTKFENVEALDSDEPANEEILIEYEDWFNLASNIEEEYSSKFEEYL